ncbi:hypothetical protein ABW19_dt0201046 [Dactylella cylindrospora]|nr:hypothetical protein ABW19_dt0201046 [Dactylella cylindrospora]
MNGEVNLKRLRVDSLTTTDPTTTKRVRRESPSDGEDSVFWAASLDDCEMYMGDFNTYSVAVDSNNAHDCQYIKDSVQELEMLDATSHIQQGNICYGSLMDAKAETTYIEQSDFSIQPWTRFCNFHVTKRGEIYKLGQSLAYADNGFGRLDNITASYLDSLQNIQGVTFQAVISSPQVEKIPREKSQKKTQKKTRIDLTINIFGPEAIAEEVGDALSGVSGYLQHPVYLEDGIKYANPHYFYPGDTMEDIRHLIGPIPIDEKSERVSQGIAGLLASLEKRTPLSQRPDVDLTAASSRLVDTKLKSHQVDGVRFMVDREDSDACYQTDRDLVSLIDLRLISNNSVPCLGGILADAMGLGKTLTTLAAIAYSKDKSQEFSEQSSTSEHQWTKSTLVVLPSRQVLDVWDSEIKRRFQPHTMAVGHFHGDRRAKSSKDLLQYDVVLTTYHTLAADWKGRKVLQSLQWFRVVLDEAHWIRNQSTQLFKAAEHLKAERRWCLTGTPIQNSLHDLRSLLKFLRHAPFSSAKQFDRYIIDPLRTDSEDSLRNLQLLLRAICLRRTDSHLELPPLTTEIVPVTLSPGEDVAYQSILTDCQAEFDKRVCTSKNPRTYGVLFATIMRLRRLCNHGTLPQDIASRSSIGGLGERACLGEQLFLGEEFGCDLCSGTEEDSLAIIEGMNECSACGRQLSTGKSSPRKKGVKGSSVKTLGGTELLEPSYSGVTSPYSPLPHSRSRSPFVADSGVSSKLIAATTNIENSYRQSSSKSIVFSSWRLTLDLLEKMLSERGIPSLRIDGRVNPAGRSTILSRFQEGSDIPVLLMTIDSCAVGLTLTAANTVHLIEPQWNPAIEAQAIGRAYRIGQTQPVTVIKYITQGTVEQNILTLQNRKSRIAKISLDSTTDGDSGGSLDDLKFVLSR